MSSESAPALPKLLVDCRDAARMLSISPRALWSLTKNGELPAVRIGKRSVRYDVESLRRWIDQRKGGAA